MAVRRGMNPNYLAPEVPPRGERGWHDPARAQAWLRPFARYVCISHATDGGRLTDGNLMVKPGNAPFLFPFLQIPS